GWTIGVYGHVRWTTNLGIEESDSRNYTMSISFDSGATWQSLGGNIGDRKASVLAPGPATTHARVRLQWSNGVVGTHGDSTDFTIVPNISVTSPNSSVTWVIGTTHSITWTHGYGASQTFDVAFSSDGGASWTPLALSVPSSNATTGSYNWTVA